MTAQSHKYRQMRPLVSQLTRIVALVGIVACGGRDHSMTILQRIRVVPLASPTGPNSAEAFVAAAQPHSVMLSWLERQADSTTVAMRVARLDSAGTWSDPVDIIRATDLFVNWADFPSVAQLADGRLLAHWLQNNSAAGKAKLAYDIRMAQSSDRGVTWTAIGSPHEPGIPTDHGFVSMLPRADSTADILFLSGAPPDAASTESHGAPMRLAMSHWEKTGRLAPAATLLDLRTCDCCQTAAALTLRGPVILYRDRSDTELRDISIRRFVDSAWTAPAPLHADGWTFPGCPVNGPAIAAVGNTLAAVWFTGANDTPKVQLMFSSDAGATFGTPVRIDAGMPLGRVDVKLLSSGDALVTWIEQRTKDSVDVRARLVRQNGTAEPSLTLATASTGRATGFPRMALYGDGVVLAWNEPGKPGTVKLSRLSIAAR